LKEAQLPSWNTAVKEKNIFWACKQVRKLREHANNMTRVYEKKRIFGIPMR